MSHEWKTALVEGPMTRAEKAEAEVERLRRHLEDIAQTDRPLATETFKEQWLSFREIARFALREQS